MTVGQKVHPVGYRLGVIYDWESRWYADKKTYAKNLHEDLRLRQWVKKRWGHAGISRIEIERIGNVMRFTVWTARPGVVIGKGGALRVAKSAPPLDPEPWPPTFRASLMRAVAKTSAKRAVGA